MTKRTSKSAGDADAKKQKTGSEEQPAAPLGPFEEATKHRSFQITVEGKSIYVNPHLLAEVSPYFDTLCLGNFKEGKEGKAELKDVKYDDVIEMLTVLGADYSKDRKEIDVSNCVTMLKLASMWQIDILMKRCIAYIENKFPKIPSTFASTLELLIACEETKVSMSALKHVASRLAAFGSAKIMQEQIFRRIQDTALCGAILMGAKEYRATSSASSNRMHTYGQRMSQGYCEVQGCPYGLAFYECRDCGTLVCDTHRDNPCTGPKVDEDEIIPETDESAANAKLDERFFTEQEKK